MVTYIARSIRIITVVNFQNLQSKSEEFTYTEYD